MQGTVLNIQRFCTSDGPGIRTTVFLKGCPLSCIWCHNPESQRAMPELLYSESDCALCARCVSACPNGCHTLHGTAHRFDRTACVACGNCLFPACRALERSGTPMTAEDILSEVLKDAAFYKNSGGGMTLSGGEPLFQPDFSLELLGLAKNAGLHTAIETCGYAKKEVIAASAELVDLYLFDYKESDPERHRAYTGVDNRLILENLSLLNSLQKRIVLRCPIIPGCNDRTDHFRAIAELANRHAHIEEIQVEPYHDLGMNKYARLGKAYKLPDTRPTDRKTAEHYVEEIRAHTDTPVRIP